MKSLCFILFLFFNLSLPAYFIQGGDQFYEEIKGSGIEQGFEFTVEYWQRDLREALPPTLIIPPIDNRADCRVDSIRPIAPNPLNIPEKEQTYSGMVKYLIRILTAIEADEGSCLIMVQDRQGLGTLKILRYSYQLELAKLLE